MEDSLHKGQMGRIGVLGGSKEYTGAPYFAGITALYCGADLVHVLCADAAAQAIKCYSPELIVHPTLDNNLEESLKWLSKLHAVVIGPGLGMVENIPITEKLMEECIRSKKPMIIDADGLYIVAKNASLVSGSRQVILTPNVNEFSRLYKTILGTEPSNDPKETSTLASALGNLTIIRKGPMDVISNGEHLVICESEGSPRRCGGQGDLLSGAAAIFSHWFSRKSFTCSYSATMAASLAACLLTRRCANLAFSKHRRSTVTMKLIEEIQPAFEQLFMHK
ncbi:unnamed protein product [Mesocestoides corti]|nr:unnamed protein product [Mesocestoides corti]